MRERAQRRKTHTPFFFLSFARPVLLLYGSGHPTSFKNNQPFFFCLSSSAFRGRVKRPLKPCLDPSPLYIQPISFKVYSIRPWWREWERESLCVFPFAGFACMGDWECWMRAWIIVRAPPRNAVESETGHFLSLEYVAGLLNQVVLSAWKPTSSSCWYLLYRSGEQEP